MAAVKGLMIADDGVPVSDIEICDICGEMFTMTETRAEYEARVKLYGGHPACGCLYAEGAACANHKQAVCKCECHQPATQQAEPQK